MESSDRPDRAHDEAEEGIIRRARDQLSRSPYSELVRITSSYHRGVLMLRGCVRSQYLKQIAQELVSRIEGVDAIVNHIEVRMAADRGPSGAGVLGRGPDPGSSRIPARPGRWRGDSREGRLIAMSRDIPIARREVQIEDAFGLRMKTAAEFICLAGRFRADVWIIHEGRRYNGRSMRDLLNIGTECGSRLELEAQGPDAEEALTALAQAVRPCAMEAATNLNP